MLAEARILLHQAHPMDLGATGKFNFAILQASAGQVSVFFNLGNCCTKGWIHVCPKNMSVLLLKISSYDLQEVIKRHKAHFVYLPMGALGAPTELPVSSKSLNCV